MICCFHLSFAAIVVSIIINVIIYFLLTVEEIFAALSRGASLNPDPVNEDENEDAGDFFINQHLVADNNNIFGTFDAAPNGDNNNNGEEDGDGYEYYEDGNGHQNGSGSHNGSHSSNGGMQDGEGDEDMYDDPEEEGEGGGQGEQ